MGHTRPASHYFGGMGLFAFLHNCIRAALLDVGFYNEAEQTRSLLPQAAAVVVLANALAGVGSAVATEASLVGTIAGHVFTGIIGWLIWSWFALVVGTQVFGGDSDYGEMVRVIGFAYVPVAIGVVPWLGFVGAVWSLVAAVIGVREGMDFTTGRAVLTMAAGWGAWLLLAILLQALIDIELSSGFPF